MNITYKPVNGVIAYGDERAETVRFTHTPPIRFTMCVVLHGMHSALPFGFYALALRYNTDPITDFLLLNNTYQAAPHPAVIDNGDCAHMSTNTRPKAGIFTVRVGQIITEILWIIFSVSHSDTTRGRTKPRV